MPQTSPLSAPVHYTPLPEQGAETRQASSGGHVPTPSAGQSGHPGLYRPGRSPALHSRSASRTNSQNAPAAPSQTENTSVSTEVTKEIDRLRGAIFELHSQRLAGTPDPVEKQKIDAALSELRTHVQIYREQRQQRQGASYGVDVNRDELARLENYATEALQDVKDAIASMAPTSPSLLSNAADTPASSEEFINQIDHLRRTISGLCNQKLAGTLTPGGRQEIDAALSELQAHVETCRREQRAGESYISDADSAKLAFLENYAAVALQGAKDAIASMTPIPEHFYHLLNDNDIKACERNGGIISSLLDKQGPISESDINRLLDAASTVRKLNRQCKAALDSNPEELRADPGRADRFYETIGQIETEIDSVVDSLIKKSISPSTDARTAPRAQTNTAPQESTRTPLDIDTSFSAIRQILFAAHREARPLNDAELRAIRNHKESIRRQSSSADTSYIDPGAMLGSILQEIAEHQATYPQGAPNTAFAKAASGIQAHIQAVKLANRAFNPEERKAMDELLRNMWASTPAGTEQEKTVASLLNQITAHNEAHPVQERTTSSAEPARNTIAPLPPSGTTAFAKAASGIQAHIQAVKLANRAFNPEERKTMDELLRNMWASTPAGTEQEKTVASLLDQIAAHNEAHPAQERTRSSAEPARNTIAPLPPSGTTSAASSEAGSHAVSVPPFDSQERPSLREKAREQISRLTQAWPSRRGGPPTTESIFRDIDQLIGKILSETRPLEDWERSILKDQLELMDSLKVLAEVDKDQVSRRLNEITAEIAKHDRDYPTPRRDTEAVPADSPLPPVRTALESRNPLRGKLPGSRQFWSKLGSRLPDPTALTRGAKQKAVGLVTTPFSLSRSRSDTNAAALIPGKKRENGTSPRNSRFSSSLFSGMNLRGRVLAALPAKPPRPQLFPHDMAGNGLLHSDTSQWSQSITESDNEDHGVTQYVAAGVAPSETESAFSSPAPRENDDRTETISLATDWKSVAEALEDDDLAFEAGDEYESSETQASDAESKYNGNFSPSEMSDSDSDEVRRSS